jgi:hypothetical protein
MQYKKHPIFDDFEFNIYGKCRNVITHRDHYGKTDQIGQKIFISGSGHKKYDYIHNFLYEVFVSDIPPNKKIIHKDGNIDNNHLSNLILVQKIEEKKETAKKYYETKHNNVKTRYDDLSDISKKYNIPVGRLEFYIKIKKPIVINNEKIFINSFVI